MKDLCRFVNYDNVEEFIEESNVKIAIIARPDWFLKEYSYTHVIVETEKGIHTRLYLTSYENVNFLVVYGRFSRIKSTSADIDYELTQEVFNMLRIKTVIGTFCVGAIQDAPAGTVYLPDQIVGMGNYNKYISGKYGFRNSDMYYPVCGELYRTVLETTQKLDFEVVKNAVYVSFHGYPRIETKAELEYYRRQGWDIVGQTMDTEATLAKASGCHYIGIAATCDDAGLREEVFDDNSSAMNEIDDITIKIRKKTFAVFLNAIQEINRMDEGKCKCLDQGNYALSKSKLFYYLPFDYEE